MKKKLRKGIRKEMTFGELLEKFPKAGMKLVERGMFCGGCPMARIETIEQGAAVHGVDVDELIDELNGIGK